MDRDGVVSKMRCHCFVELPNAQTMTLFCIFFFCYGQTRMWCGIITKREVKSCLNKTEYKRQSCFRTVDEVGVNRKFGGCPAVESIP